jgi:Recombinase
VSAVSSARRPGRPPTCPLEVVIRVVELHRRGLSYAEISVVLNREGIPTPAGRPVWQKSYVDRLLHTRYAQDIWDG